MKFTELSSQDLFFHAMSGVKSQAGMNKEARAAELAIHEMFRRLKLLEQNNDLINLHAPVVHN